MFQLCLFTNHGCYKDRNALKITLWSCTSQHYITEHKTNAHFPSKHLVRFLHGYFFAFPSSASKAVISNNSLSHRAQSASRLLMSHHAPCSNLLMPLTCLSHSPPRPVPLLILAPLALLLFTPDTPSLLFSAHSSQGKVKRPGCSACHGISAAPEKPDAGCLRDEVTTAVAL